MPHSRQRRQLRHGHTKTIRCWSSSNRTNPLIPCSTMPILLIAAENLSKRNNCIVRPSTWIQVILTRYSGWPSSRNVAANAGMSALTTDDNRESRLKTLLNEQQNSSSLHFALGNYYAEQARWGEAQQAYFNGYRLEPDNAELAFNLAVSLDRLGQKKSAAQYYQRALQLDPEHNAGFDHAKISQRIEELTH